MKDKACSESWFCTQEDLEKNIVDWLSEEEIGLHITAVEMTEEEFNKLPES